MKITRQPSFHSFTNHHNHHSIALSTTRAILYQPRQRLNFEQQQCNALNSQILWEMMDPTNLRRIPVQRDCGDCVCGGNIVKKWKWDSNLVVLETMQHIERSIVNDCSGAKRRSESCELNCIDKQPFAIVIILSPWWQKHRHSMRVLSVLHSHHFVLSVFGRCSGISRGHQESFMLIVVQTFWLNNSFTPWRR